MNSITVDGQVATSNERTTARDFIRAQVSINPHRRISLDEMYRAVGSPEGKSPVAWLDLAEPLLAGFASYHQQVHERFFPSFEDGYHPTSGAWTCNRGDTVAEVELAMLYAMFLDNCGMLTVYTTLPAKEDDATDSPSILAFKPSPN